METLVDPRRRRHQQPVNEGGENSFPARDVPDQAIRADLTQILQLGKNGGLSPSLLGPGSCRRRHHLAAWEKTTM